MTGSRDLRTKLETLKGHRVGLELLSGRRVIGRLTAVLRDALTIETGEGETLVALTALALVEPPPAPTGAAAPTPMPTQAQARALWARAEHLPEDPDVSSWHRCYATDDNANYRSLRADVLSDAEPSTAERQARREAIRALIDRHPASLELQVLRAADGFRGGQPQDLYDSCLKALAIDERPERWAQFALAATAQERPTEALIACERALTALSYELWPELWQLTRALLEATEAQSLATELQRRALSQVDQDGAELIEAWFQAHMTQRTDTAEAALAEDRARLRRAIDKDREELKFAMLEEDLNGLIFEARKLARNGKLNSAFDKLNEAYRLSPTNPRVRAVEEQLRANDGRARESYDLEGLEVSLQHIVSQHDHLVLDTSVLSLPDSFDHDERVLDRVLKSVGKHGIATLEEKVSYHKMIERSVSAWSGKFYVSKGVVTEIRTGLAAMKDRKALETFGRSGASLTRLLERCVSGPPATRRDEKKLRALKHSFHRLRSHGGLSEVDYDLLCRAYYLTSFGAVALMSNDRGILAGCKAINEAHSAGNQNIEFLKPEMLRFYCSLERSRFQQVPV
jgi:hypothetical protein